MNNCIAFESTKYYHTQYVEMERVMHERIRALLEQDQEALGAFDDYMRNMDGKMLMLRLARFIVWYAEREMSVSRCNQLCLYSSLPFE